MLDPQKLPLEKGEISMYDLLQKVHGYAKKRYPWCDFANESLGTGWIFWVQLFCSEVEVRYPSQTVRIGVVVSPSYMREKLSFEVRCWMLPHSGKPFGFDPDNIRDHKLEEELTELFDDIQSALYLVRKFVEITE